MAGTSFTAVNYNLIALIEMIDLGTLALPDIQRPFVWTPAKVRDLFDSMYRGFPVGYFLFWANGLVEGSRPIGMGIKQTAPSRLIVDGQQRLTSLYAVFKGKPVVGADYTARPIQIAFRPRDGKFEVLDAAIARDPEYLPDISKVWSSDIPWNRLRKDFLARLHNARDVSDAEEDQLDAALEQLRALQNYPFNAVELSANVDEEQVAEVFVRINSKGVALKQADFILTLMSVFWDDGRRALEQFCREARQPSTSGPSPFNHFLQPEPDQLLRAAVALAFRRARLEHVYSLLRGKDLETKQFSAERRDEQFRALESAQKHVLDLTNWHEFLKALMTAGFRSGAVVSSQTGLVYTYALYLIGRHDFKVPNDILRRTIARWFFFSQLTGRYTGSSESAMEEDLARLRSVHDAESFMEVLDRTISERLTDDYWRIQLPGDLVSSAARSPSLFAYYAALNLLRARVLFSTMSVADLLDPTVKAQKASLERHHLFPRAYLQRLGTTDLREVNQIANYALVEWADNVSISDAPPHQYVPKMLAARGIGPTERQQSWYWHALPENWEQMEYQDFLTARRRRMAAVIRDGFATLQAASVAQVSAAG